MIIYQDFVLTDTKLTYQAVFLILNYVSVLFSLQSSVASAFTEN